MYTPRKYYQYSSNYPITPRQRDLYQYSHSRTNRYSNYPDYSDYTQVANPNTNSNPNPQQQYYQQYQHYYPSYYSGYTYQDIQEDIPLITDKPQQVSTQVSITQQTQQPQSSQQSQPSRQSQLSSIRTPRPSLNLNQSTNQPSNPPIPDRNLSSSPGTPFHIPILRSPIQNPNQAQSQSNSSQLISIQKSITTLEQNLTSLRDSFNQIQHKLSTQEKICNPSFSIDGISLKSRVRYHHGDGTLHMTIIFDSLQEFKHVIYPMGSDLNHVLFPDQNISCLYCWADGTVDRIDGYLDQISGIVRLTLKQNLKIKNHEKSKWPLTIVSLGKGDPGTDPV